VASIFKLSNQSVATGLQAHYDDMLAGNATFIPFTPSGAFDSIATVNGTGSSATITFSSIPQTYTHLQIRYIAKETGSGTGSDNFYIRCNGDNGTQNNYSYHYIYGYNSAVGTTGHGTYSEANLYVTGGGGDTGMGAGVIDIFDYSNTNKYKTFRGLTGNENNNQYSALQFASGLYQQTTAISSLSLSPMTGNWATTTTFALYGIK
jgi:hypothetical protein